MNFLCERIGFFLKQGSSAQDIKIYYFFVDDDFGLFYCRNYAYMERIYRESDTIPEVSLQMTRRSFKRIKFNNCKISSLKTFPTLEYIPFPNKNCFELTISQKKYKSILIFALFDDNINLLYDFLKNYNAYLKKINRNVLSAPMEYKERHQTKKTTNFRKFSPGKIFTESEAAQELAEYTERFKMFLMLVEEQKQKKSSEILQKDEEIIENNTSNSRLFEKNKEKIELNEENKQNKEEEKQDNPEGDQDLSEENQVIILKNGNTYTGQIKNGLPHGQGTEFREDGLSYKGDFKNGKWHGMGYLVNSNLDLCYAEFIEGEPVGF